MLLLAIYIENNEGLGHINELSVSHRFWKDFGK